MKRVLICLAIVLVPGLLCGLAWAGLEGSSHDFSGADWTDGDLCIACHVPHREEDPTEAPLWDPEADLSQRFTEYGRREGVDPGAGSLACIVCHDGTVARDTSLGALKPHERYENKDHPSLFAVMHQNSNHPVGVAYPMWDRYFNPASLVMSRGVPLPDGQVECTSCHDPHGTDDFAHMLVVSNQRSALCLNCHKK